MDRRGVMIGGMALTAGVATALRAGAAVGPLELIVGTYREEGGKGLVRLRYDVAQDRLTPGAPIEAIANASFGVHSRRFGLHYLLDEKAPGTIGAYRGEADGWRRHADLASGGDAPCHAALSPRENALAVANYSSGTLALFRLDPKTGLPLDPPQISANRGTGPNRERQEGPHGHWVGFSPDGRWLYQVDLGTDAVLGFPIEPQGMGERRIAYQAPAGSGPRHLALHPRLSTAYLVTELTNQILTLDRAADGSLRARQMLPLLPQGFAGHSQAAHIAIDAAGRRLYVSNRGHDSIAVFAIDSQGGLKLLQHISTGGSWPRFFLLLEAQRRLLVANERAGTIVPFAIASNGTLSRTGEPVAVPGAVFIAPA